MRHALSALMFTSSVWLAVTGVACDPPPDDPTPDDAGPQDAGPDDAGPQDAGPQDAGPDDAGPADAGPPPADWSDCPTADAHVADPSWTEALTFDDDFVTCTVVPENNTGAPIGDTFRQKLMMRLPAGSYRLPSDDVSAPWTVPLCIKTGAAAAPTGIAGAGSIERAGDLTTALQPLEDGVARLSVSTFWGPTWEICVTGDDCAFDVGTVPARTMGDSCTRDEAPWSTPNPAVFRRNLLTVDFEGGALTFDVVIIVGSDNPDIIGLYPVAGPLLSVRGSYEDVAIDTRDYWQMAYAAGHHVVGQYFGVVLPTPVGDTCALEVVETDPFAADGTQVHRLGCDFERLGELAVTARTVVEYTGD